MTFQYKKLSPDVQDLVKAHPDDAGFDLRASEDIIVGKKAVIPTGIVVAIPRGYYGRVASRSGLSVKYDVEVGAGVIDSEYRGEIKVVLRNFGPNAFIVKKGDRIAQLILTVIYVGEVKCVEELDVTDRGEGGFGSTGVN